MSSGTSSGDQPDFRENGDPGDPVRFDVVGARLLQRGDLRLHVLERGDQCGRRVLQCLRDVVRLGRVVRVFGGKLDAEFLRQCLAAHGLDQHRGGQSFEQFLQIHGLILRCGAPRE